MIILIKTLYIKTLYVHHPLRFTMMNLLSRFIKILLAKISWDKNLDEEKSI